MTKEKHGAAIIFFTSTGVILQRKDDTFPRFPNALCIIGGAIQEAETAEAAIKREIEEEFDGKLSCNPIFFREITDYREPIDTIHHHHVFYAQAHEGMENIKINEGKGIENVSWETILGEEDTFMWSHRLTLQTFYQEMVNSLNLQKTL
jgi:8-oxo-dGTP pyrophosphatase MutT (NUDIX family)